ncbi:MAG: dephospho-CoA kinase [Flavobacteriales bacterium]|nr:dephospho-CoA kinase [Flavobacteriales bacterium]
MLRVGLTGGIGSGKSVVARMLQVLGVPVFEADAEAKTLMQQDAAVRDAVMARFGAEVYANGALDRTQLASKVFGNDEEIAALNAMVHPAVRKAFAAWADEQTFPYAVMEAAIMAENDGYRSFDRVVTVSCPEAIRIQRVMERDGVEEEAVRTRTRHQASEEDRLRIAHFTVKNDGSELLIPQVLAIHGQLLKLVAS